MLTGPGNLRITETPFRCNETLLLLNHLHATARDRGKKKSWLHHCVRTGTIVRTVVISFTFSLMSHSRQQPASLSHQLGQRFEAARLTAASNLLQLWLTFKSRHSYAVMMT